MIFQSLFLYAAPASASADPKFFNVNDSWNDRFRYLGEFVTEMPEETGFLQGAEDQSRAKGPAAKYFKEKIAEDPDNFIPKPPPPQILSLYEIQKKKIGTLEIELDQVASLEVSGLRRYAVTTPDRVELYRDPNSEILQIKGVGVGTTTLHIWNNTERVTIPVRVIPQKQFAEYTRRVQERVEGSQSFKAEYGQTRSAFYAGNSLEDLSQSSLSYSQNFGLRGDTPYGYLTGGAVMNEFDDKNEISSITAKLTDAKVGPIDNFDLTLMDNSITPNLYSLPALRLRGVTVDYGKRPEDRARVTAFYGREQPNLFGTLVSSGSGGGERGDRDSFVGGSIVDVKPFENAEWKAAYFQAEGQERIDDLNNHAIELVQDYKWGTRYKAGADMAYDTAHFASKIYGEADYDWIKGGLEYRDVSKDFFAITGNPASQGEQGVRLNVFSRPWDPLEIRYAVDIYRDRLFPLPGEENRFNVRQDTEATLQLDPYSSLRADYRGSEEAALLSPSRSDSYGLTYNRSFELLQQRMTFFAGIRNENFESLSNPESNYRRATVNTGYSTKLFWDIYFTYSYNISNLEEMTLRRITWPRVASYTLSQSRQVGNTPFSYDLQLRLTDEESTESPRSFMIGEDRFEASGELRYTQSDLELYVNSRYSNIRGESRVIENAQAEAEVTTGVRYIFDTKIRWEPQASFKGIVWKDLNSDGFRQTEEPGIEGVKIRVGAHEVVTGPGGFFETPPLAGKRVAISVDPDSIPQGFAGSTPLHREAALRDAGEVLYFGLTGRSSIIGYIYNDLNNNGRFDASDKGLESVRMTLDGKTPGLSDSEGRYRFPGVSTGSHEVAMDLKSLPLGYLPSGPLKQTGELTEGIDFQLNFPLRARRILTGRVFLDADDSNRFGDGDTPIKGARVHFGPHSAETDKDGYYLFDNVLPGSYALTVDPSSVRYRVLFQKELSFDSKPKEMSVDIPLESDE